MPIASGCISFLLFDPVVRYGTGYPNTGDLDNQGEPVPNAPYGSCLLPIAYCLLPIAYCLLPYSLLPCL
ncbi:MAG: hypothetical protein F6K55_30255 [Moorea sp. SIO4A3]|nr:hypothetical protein [Moorena sp. SIO4A3]